MKLCRKCFYYDVCLLHEDNWTESANKNGFCGKFLNKADVVLKNQWISVEDELPEITSTEKGWGDHKVKKSVRVLCACKQKSGKVLVKEGYYELWDYATKPYWKIPGSIDSVTHWMPLPTLPTEKEN